MTNEIGTFIKYANKNFTGDRLVMLTNAAKILHEYEQNNMVMTLRQLHYQFVSRDLYANIMENYNKLGTLVSDGRIAGALSWTAIEDRERNLRGLDHSESPADALQQARDAYRIDLWAGQPMRPEVWIEKNSLVASIAPVCQELRVNYFSTKGYNSQSEAWNAGRRFAGYYQRGQRPVVFHLGDHDPSGIDMTRDNRERLALFAGTDVMVVRLALNFDQILKYGPPPNPAKMTDSRAADYVERFGDESWELDALDPKVMWNLIRDAVLKLRNEELWGEALAQEATDLDAMDRMIEGFV